MSYQELPTIKLLFDIAFVSQNLNIFIKKTATSVHTWTRCAPYLKLFCLPREAMTSILDSSNSNSVINSLFSNIAVNCDRVCLLKYNFNPNKHRFLLRDPMDQKVSNTSYCPQQFLFYFGQPFHGALSLN